MCHRATGSDHAIAITIGSGYAITIGSGCAIGINSAAHPPNPQSAIRRRDKCLGETTMQACLARPPEATRADAS